VNAAKIDPESRNAVQAFANLVPQNPIRSVLDKFDIGFLLKCVFMHWQTLSYGSFCNGNHCPYRTSRPNWNAANAKDGISESCQKATKCVAARKALPISPRILTEGSMDNRTLRRAASMSSSHLGDVGSFDHLICPKQNGLRNRKPESIGFLKIDE
jgi:hypothetical protein